MQVPRGQFASGRLQALLSEFVVIDSDSDQLFESLLGVSTYIRTNPHLLGQMGLNEEVRVRVMRPADRLGTWQQTAVIEVVGTRTGNMYATLPLPLGGALTMTSLRTIGRSLQRALNGVGRRSAASAFESWACPYCDEPDHDGACLRDPQPSQPRRRKRRAQ